MAEESLRPMPIEAHEIMHPGVLTISPEATIPTLERTLADAGVGGLPVVANDRLVGMVSLTDILRRLCSERDHARINVGLYGRESEVDYMPYDIAKDVADLVGERMDRLRVRDVMTAHLIVVSPNTQLNEMAELLVKHRINRLPVVKDNRLVGLVTGRDVICALASLPVTSQHTSATSARAQSRANKETET